MPSYVVAGASRGIGFEYVRQLSANENNTVFGIVRNKTTATQLATLNRSNVHIVQADITDHEALKAAAAEVEKVTGGSLDYLINNAAAVGDDYSSLTLAEFEYQDILAQNLREKFNVNVVGVVFTINAFLPLLEKGSVKKVITISSGVGDLDLMILSGNATDGPYAISKAATNMVVAKYAAQYKNAGFVFLALSPGLVNTSTAPPTSAQIAAFTKMMPALKKYAPSFEGPITPEQSVEMQLDVINKITVKDSGAFVSHYGNKQWI